MSDEAIPSALCERSHEMTLLSLLHVCDSLFPIGSFGYSDGLESATTAGLVRTVGDVRDWLDVCLDEAFGRCDGPGLLGAWSAVHDGDWEALVALDEELTALRPSSATRTANRSMGLRLLKTWHALHPDARLAHALALVGDHTFSSPRRAGGPEGPHDRDVRPRLGPTLPVAFAAVSVCAGISCRDALSGFAYTRLAATVSAAMRLVALGQTDAHRLLSRALERVPPMIDEVIARAARPESFTPAMDVAQMMQQYVHSRLFRS